MLKSIFLMLVLSLSISSVAAQPLKNLDLFFNLVDNFYLQFKDKIPEKVKVDFQGDDDYSILKNRFVYNLGKDGKKDDINSPDEIKITIQSAKVDYSYIDESVNLIGGYEINRSINLQGSVLIYKNGELQNTGEFNKSVNDAVSYDLIPGLETANFKFTQSKLPEESFFSGLIEPLVAVAALATAIYLLFTVRSN